MLKFTLCRKQLGSTMASVGTLSNTKELQIFDDLSANFRRLFSDTSFVEQGDVRHSMDETKLSSFLNTLESTMRELAVPRTPRRFREDYTINYRVIFPDEDRHYRADILIAALCKQFSRWVNGERFDSSSNAVTSASRLSTAWADLAENMVSRYRQGRKAIRELLADFDFAMAEFEHKFIFDLITAESKAKSYLTRAIKQDQLLRHLARHHQGTTDELEHIGSYTNAESRLIACMSVLNSRANVHGKGRDDMRYEVLVRARAALRDSVARGDETAIKDPPSIIAAVVMTSYNSFRDYLQQVGGCIERVHPHLRNNSELVRRVEDFEKAWELGAAYLLDEDMCTSLCNLVEYFRRVAEIFPSLWRLVENYDVELFFLLPRMIMLRFLHLPRSVAALVQSLLPHRFTGSLGASSTDADVRRVVDGELGALMERFAEAKHDAASEADARSNKIVRPMQLLVRSSLCSCAADGVVTDVEATEEELACPPDMRRMMLEMEGLCIELQRRHPEIWNPCCEVLTRCLAQGR